MLTTIKLHRLTKGLKALDLALRASISVSLLSKIENGKCKGSVKTRQKIAKVLGIATEILFGEK